MSLFKRRSSSKDLSAKIGYDLTPKKYERGIPTSGASPSTSMAPVSNITTGGPTHQKQASSSSILSYRKTSAPSPHGMGGGGVDDISYGGTPLAAGPSPLSSFKQSLPPSGAAAAAAAAAAATASFSNGTAMSAKSLGQGPALSDAPPRRRSSSSSSSTSGSPSKQQVEPPAKSLVIGEGVLFEGTTEGCAAAVVGGKLRGTVKSRRLEVTRAGRMEGTAFAETAEIAGTFEGSLTVTKALKICSTGRFKGDVSFGSIVVENGGKLEGKVNYGGCRSPLPETEDGAGSGANGSGEDSSSSTTTTTTKTKTTSGTTAAKAPTPVGTATPVTTPTATATPITTTTPTSPGTVMPSVAATAAAFKKPVLAAASVGPGSGIGRVKLLRVTGASPRSSLRPVPIQSPE